MAKVTLVLRGLTGLHDRGRLGWKMNVFPIPHDPSVVVVDWGYPMFPEERGTQNCIVPFNIRDIEVYLSMYGPEFHGNPGPIVDL